MTFPGVILEGKTYWRNIVDITCGNIDIHWITSEVDSVLTPPEGYKRRDAFYNCENGSLFYISSESGHKPTEIRDVEEQIQIKILSPTAELLNEEKEHMMRKTGLALKI